MRGLADLYVILWIAGAIWLAVMVSKACVERGRRRVGVVSSFAIGGSIIFWGYLHASTGSQVSGWACVIGGVVAISLGIRAAAVGSKEEIELGEKMEKLEGQKKKGEEEE